jgi:hypothetical protein
LAAALPPLTSKPCHATLLAQIQQEQSDETDPSTNRQLDGARKCLHAPQLLPLLADVSKCTAARDSRAVALALLASSKPELATTPPVKRARRERPAGFLLL